jgi:hypothetical protein
MTSQHHDHPDTGIPAVIVQAQRQIRELADILWAARTPAELMDGIAEIEALKSTASAVQLAMVRELDATNVVTSPGVGLHPGLRHHDRRRSQGLWTRHRAAGGGGRHTAPFTGG